MVAIRLHFGTTERPDANMSVNLSIKNVPEHLAQRLRERAARNHRSIQGELMAILEETLGANAKTVDDIYAEVVRLGLATPDDSVKMLREDRDER